MEKKYTFNSKVNIQPARSTHVFAIVLNVCLVLVMLTGLIKIIRGGFRWDTLASMVLAFAIVTAFQKRPGSREHYEAAVAECSLSVNAVEIRYSVNGAPYKSYACTTRDIRAIEYSDRLNCVHIVGDLRSLAGKKEEKTGQVFVYLDGDTAEELLSELTAVSGVKITYMDR